MPLLKPLNFRTEASAILPNCLAVREIRSGLESRNWGRKINCLAIEIERPVAAESQHWTVMRVLMNYS